jgi:hypothetical protein
MVMLEPEIIYVNFPYSSVGGKFTDVIQTIMSDRESGINNTFFSGSGVESSSFDMSDAFKDLDSAKGLADLNVEMVSIGTKEEVKKVSEGMETGPSKDTGYVPKVITPNEGDFSDFI